MEKFDFRIANDAAEYLRNVLLRTATGESLVLAIAPLSSQHSTLKFRQSDRNLSDKELAECARAFLSSLSSPVKFHWVVGGMHKSRLSGEKTSFIDGIECFLPDEVRSVVNGRVLRLRNGELVFEPELDLPPSLSLPGAG
jgi:hypothetical protein